MSKYQPIPSFISQTPQSNSTDLTFGEKLKFHCGCCPCVKLLGNLEKRKNFIDLGSPIPGKKTLILDLDETLVHTFVQEPPQYDFSIKVEVGTFSYSLFVCKRPSVDEFLGLVAQFFEVVIFTASTYQYASQIIDKIAPFVPTTHRLYRNNCTLQAGLYIKNLNPINRNLADMIICDNNPISFVLNMENGITIESFVGQKDDKELLNVLWPKLRKLIDVDDVRKVISDIS